MSSSAADICTLVWPIAYEEENTFVLQEQQQLAKIEGDTCVLGNTINSKFVHLNNSTNAKELAGRWIVGWNPRGLSVIVAWFFACETYHEAAEQLEIVKRILSHHHYKNQDQKKHKHTCNSNNNYNSENNYEYKEEDELSPFIGSLLHYSHEWKHTSEELGYCEHYFCEEEELEEEEEENSLESQSEEHELHYEYTTRRRSSIHSGTPHYSDLQILGYLRNIPIHSPSGVREGGSSGLPFSPSSPRRTFPTFPVSNSVKNNNYNGCSGDNYEDNGINPCSPASPGPMVLRENTVRLMRQQNDIWLELQHGPVLGEVWCCGCRVQPCQLHVIRVDARKISSTRPHLWSATSLYGSSALVNLLMRGEKPICVPGARSTVEGVLLPKVMIGESSPTIHNTMSNMDNDNNIHFSKSKRTNGMSGVITTSNNDYSSTYSKNGTFSLNKSLFLGNHSSGSVISHDNNDNRSSSLSNNMSYTTTDNTTQNGNQYQNVDHNHGNNNVICGGYHHPYEVSVQSSSETITSTPTTTITTTTTTSYTNTAMPHHNTNNTNITREYKNNSHTATKPSNAASVSESTPTLLCNSIQLSNSLTQTQKNTLPTSKQTHNKRKIKEHAANTNGVKVELHEAIHTQNRSTCESIDLIQVPNSHEQEQQHEEMPVIAKIIPDVPCKHANPFSLKTFNQDQCNGVVPTSSSSSSSTECKQWQGTDNIEKTDKINISENGNNINNDKIDIASNGDDDMINSSFETTIKVGSSSSLESTPAVDHFEHNSRLTESIKDVNWKNSENSFDKNEYIVANGNCKDNKVNNIKANTLRKVSETTLKEMSTTTTSIKNEIEHHSVADTTASITNKCESESIRKQKANENESSNIFTEREANSLLESTVEESNATTRRDREVQKKPESGLAPRLDFPLSIDEAEMSTMIAVSRAGCNVREVIEILESIAEGKEGNVVVLQNKMNTINNGCYADANSISTQQTNSTKPTLTLCLTKKENKNIQQEEKGRNSETKEKNYSNNTDKKVAHQDTYTNQVNKELEEELKEYQENKAAKAKTVSDKVTSTDTLSTLDEWILWLVGITIVVLSKVTFVLSTLSRYSYTMAIAEIRLRALINFLSLLTHKTRSCGLHPVLPHLLTGHTVRRTSVWCVGNFLTQLIVDCVLGTLLCLLLATGGPPLHGWAVRVSRYFLYETHMSYLDWFDGWPAGLKVNGDLNITLCFFAKLIMNLWDWMMRVSPNHVWQWWTSTSNATHVSEDEFCHRQWPQWQWSYTTYNNLFVNTSIATQFNSSNNSNTTTYINCANSDVDLYSFHYNYRWIPPCYYSLVLISITGASSAFAFVADLSRFVSLQLQLLYHTMALLMRLAVTIVSNLYRQFRGQRYNPLRQRVDAYDFDLDQMLLATFLFTVAVFLFPTLMVYYVYFAFVRVTIWYMQRMLSTIAFMILYVPLFPVLYWHLYRHKWRGGVVLGSPRISRMKSNVLSGNVREGVSFTVDVSVHVVPLLFSHVISDFAVVFRLLVKELSLSKMFDILLHATVPQETNLVSKLIPHLRANAIDPPCTLCVEHEFKS